MKKSVHSEVIKQAVFDKLKSRGVKIEELAEVVYEMQIGYNPSLTLDVCFENVLAVLEKRELQHTILVGIELDLLAEQRKLSEPLQQLLEKDESLFGCDETIALGAAFSYGSIAITTFGHLDKEKIGVIKRYDTKAGKGEVHTFLDDLLCAIVAMAAARVAHNEREQEEM
jgi:phosphatidylglycerophosphatase A